MALVHTPAPANLVELTDISAGWRYSSGSGHFAHDYPMPLRTPLYAVRDGIVTDCNNGVVDHTPHKPGNFDGQAGSGSPSNWVLLQVTYRGRPATVYYQHLFDTQVKKGQRVTAGQIIGRSGSTGNSTGPHLHIAAQWGGGYDQWDRYKYMQNDGKNEFVIWRPSRLWGTDDFVSFKNLGKGKKNSDVLQVQKALRDTVGLDYSSAPGTWGPKTQDAWRRFGKISGRPNDISRLRALGAKASRAHGITATP